MRRSTLAAAGLLGAMVAASALAYPAAPDRVATHWNAAGQPDGHMAKEVGLFLVPGVAALVLGGLAAVPRIDPRGGIERFRGAYDAFAVALAAFLLYVHLVVVAVNVGYDVDVAAAVLPGVAILLYAAGVVVERAEPNWFVGVRTPWTLESDEVWDRTHRLAGRLFKLSAGVTLLGLAVREWAVYFVAGPAALTALLTAAYSVYAYRQLERDAGA